MPSSVIQRASVTGRKNPPNGNVLTVTGTVNFVGAVINLTSNPTNFRQDAVMRLIQVGSGATVSNVSSAQVLIASDVAASVPFEDESYVAVLLRRRLT